MLGILLWLLQSSTNVASLPDVSTLLRQASVVGFVRMTIESMDPSSPWKQHLFVDSIELFKGTLVRDARTSRPSVVFADPVVRSDYPAWFDTQGAEYLVFLQRKPGEDWETFTTLASFQLIYEPDKRGGVVGYLLGSSTERLTRDEIRACLASTIRGGPEAQRSTDSLARLFREVTIRLSVQGAREPVPHETRLLDARRLAAAVRIGTIRRDIEKIFPREDGGMSGPGSTRYYLGSEVMVEVPFDQNGGAWKPNNKVNGPLKVYRSRPHAD